MVLIKIGFEGTMEEMQRRLKEAAVEGNVIALLKLLEEDKLALDGCAPDCFAETPLHISAMLGHLEFTRKILCRKPEFAKELDFLGSSPLHLATANGHLEVVRALLSVNPDMCFAQNRDGRNPLHIAVIKGRVDVLKELVQNKPEAVLHRTARGETVLHLCVKHFQLEALKLLVETIKDYGFINSKDEDGSTVLHLAVADKETEIISFLTMKTEIEVNAINASGFTALDIALAQGRRNWKDVDVQDSLHQVGASSAKDLSSTMHRLDAVGAMNLRSEDHFTSSQSRLKRKHRRRQSYGLGEKRNALMIVASLIATMAFQAGINPPGGLWQQDLQGANEHEAGRSIMADKFPAAYNKFVLHNSIAFLASLSVILLLISGLPFRWRFSMWILTAIMWVAITESTFTYLISIYCLSSLHQRRTYIVTVVVLSVVMLGLLSVLLVGHSVRLIPKIVKFGRRLMAPRDRRILFE
ncbi:ankyrin repeat-containing protein BDA1-like [Populus alba x Populus x berolinensis]|uniref:Ankyrin repeat-containing protein BDA1-like n=1 Tax=Populus alba x Populus x berolinensis TaxID=444605 RepID=A0AAD6QQ98_9ROSI|nr:ankyrin repeat-containing protein BDA1-like [Populus alba x Populus x berolinensis]